MPTITATSEEDFARDLVIRPWSTVLMARVERAPTAELDEVGGNLLFVASTAEGLRALENSKLPISKIWLLAQASEDSDALHVERIDEIMTWNLMTADGRRLNVLRGQKGRLFAIDDDDAFVLHPNPTSWSGSGPYSRVPSSETEVQNGDSS